MLTFGEHGTALWNQHSRTKHIQVNIFKSGTLGRGVKTTTECTHLFHYSFTINNSTDALFLGSHGNMSEESSRSSQEGLDGLHGDGKQPTMVHRTDCRPHPPVTRVCTTPQLGRPRLQLNINPRATSHINNTLCQQQVSGHGGNSRLQGGVNSGEGCPNTLNDGRCPPPYNAHHRLASSQSSPQLTTAQQPPLQHGKPVQSNSTSTTEAQMVPQSPEWQDWQRDRWQIWQLLSSDNADTLPETLVWFSTIQALSMTFTSHPSHVFFCLPLDFLYFFFCPASLRRVVVVYVCSCWILQPLVFLVFVQMLLKLLLFLAYLFCP